MKKDYETMTVGEIVADNFGNAEERERIWMRLSKTLRTLLR